MMGGSMDSLPALPAEKAALLARLVERLSAVPGVLGIVLGGSYAAGAAHAESDLDLGLFYAEARPFDLAAIRAIAGEVSAAGSPTVTDFYGWGRWVNGGAWIHTTAGKVDFLYRNLAQVEQTIADAQQGRVEHDYPQQPAYGFYSVIYLAELEICRPLFDPHGTIAGLKRQVAVYPPRLKQGVVQGALWSAEFSLVHARGFAAKGDVYATAGCLTRVAAALTQALFALNERYFLTDKRALETLAALPLVPDRYVERLSGLLAAPGASPAALLRSVEALAALWHDVVALAGPLYAPQFEL
jgi:hypothetical protein